MIKYLNNGFLSTTTGGHCTSLQPHHSSPLPTLPPSLVTLSRISPFFHQIKLFVHTDNCSISYFLEQTVQRTPKYTQAVQLKTKSMQMISYHSHMGLRLHIGGSSVRCSNVVTMLRSCFCDNDRSHLLHCCHDCHCTLNFFFLLLPHATSCTSVILIHTRHTESRARRI